MTNPFQESLKKAILPDKKKESKHPYSDNMVHQQKLGYNQAIDEIERRIEECCFDLIQIVSLICSEIPESEDFRPWGKKVFKVANNIMKNATVVRKPNDRRDALHKLITKGES